MPAGAGQPDAVRARGGAGHHGAAEDTQPALTRVCTGGGLGGRVGGRARVRVRVIVIVRARLRLRLRVAGGANPLPIVSNMPPTSMPPASLRSCGAVWRTRSRSSPAACSGEPAGCWGWPRWVGGVGVRGWGKVCGCRCGCRWGCRCGCRWGCKGGSGWPRWVQVGVQVCAGAGAGGGADGWALRDGR